MNKQPKRTMPIELQRQLAKQVLGERGLAMINSGKLGIMVHDEPKVKSDEDTARLAKAEAKRKMRQEKAIRIGHRKPTVPCKT